MDNSPPGDARLDDAEARMRRALGLDGNPVPVAVRTQPASPPFDHHPHPHRRKFVRDGDVPVTIIRHHDHSAEPTNQLDAARQAIRTQASAREHAERLLEQAQATVRQLQTTVAHERLANDEAIARADADRRTVEHALETVHVELAAEKIAHERAEQALRDAQVTITNLTEKLHGAQQALQSTGAELATERQQAQAAVRTPISKPATDAAANGEQPAQTVRRPVGRPRKHPVVLTVEKPIAAATTHPPANGDEPVQTVRRPRGRPRKQPVVEAVEKPLKAAGKGSGRSAAGDEGNRPKKVVGRLLQREKPVKWWLTGR